MKKKLNLLDISFILLVMILTTSSYANSIENSSVNKGDIEQGKLLWQKNYKGIAPFVNRSCESCHGKDLSKTGQHIKTKRKIKPMAVSVNSKRFSNARKVAKWFLRNCKWTMARECTVQEKANILKYLKSL